MTGPLIQLRDGGEVTIAPAMCQERHCGHVADMAVQSKTGRGAFLQFTRAEVIRLRDQLNIILND